jgi:hypothetical protein
MWNDFKWYCKQVIVSLDQTLLNVLFSPIWNSLYYKRIAFKGPFGFCDETLSSVLGKVFEDTTFSRRFARFVDWLFFWQKDHTSRSIEKDEGLK